MAWTVDVQGSFYDIENGDLHEVFIGHDAASPVTALTLQMGATPLVIDHRTQDGKATARIVQSRATATFVIEESSDLTAIQNIVKDFDTTYYLEYYKNSEKIWAGILIKDGGRFYDSPYPYEFEMAAADCIGNLRQYNGTVEAGLVTITDNGSFLDFICAILTQSRGILGSASVRSYVKLLDTGNLTYNANNDGLYLSKTGSGLIKGYDSDGNIIHLDHYTALESILNMFNARIFYEGEIYHIVELGAWDETAVSSYNFPANTNTTVAMSQTISDNDRESGGTYTFYPVYYKAIQKADIKFSNYYTYNKQVTQNASTFTNLASVNVSSLTSILITGVFKGAFSLTSIGGPPFARVKIDIYVRIGTNYFTSAGTWTSTATPITILSSMWLDPVLTFQWIQQNVNLNLTNLPGSGTQTLSIRYQVSAVDAAGNTVSTTGTPSSTQYKIESEEIRINTTFDYGQSNYGVTDEEYSVTNDDVSDSNLEAVFPKIYASEDATTNGTVRIYTWDGSAFVESSKSWTAYGLGTGERIHYLALKRFLATVGEPQYVYEGVYIDFGTISIYKAVTFGGRSFVHLQRSQDVKRGINRVLLHEYILGAYNWDTKKRDTSNDLDDNGLLSFSQSIGGGGLGGGRIGVGSNGLQGFTQMQRLTTTTAAIADGDTVTSISINSISGNVLRSNDTLHLYNPATEEYQFFTVDEAYSSGETSISIVSKTSSYNFPKGSFIFINSVDVGRNIVQAI